MDRKSLAGWSMVIKLDTAERLSTAQHFTMLQIPVKGSTNTELFNPHNNPEVGIIFILIIPFQRKFWYGRSVQERFIKYFSLD